MNEENIFIKQLIIDFKNLINELLMEIIDEFDDLERKPSTERKFHSRSKIRMYRKKLSVIITKYKKASSLVLKVLIASRAFLDTRDYKANKIRELIDGRNNNRAT